MRPDETIESERERERERDKKQQVIKRKTTYTLTNRCSTEREMSKK